MGVTTTYGWRAPNLADSANGPANILTAIQDVENTVKDKTVLTYTPSWTAEGDVQPAAATQLIGYYRVDHGICHLLVRLMAGPPPTARPGFPPLTLLLAPAPPVSGQMIEAKIWCPAGSGGLYRGHAEFGAGTGTTMFIYFPASASDTRLSQWRNTDATHAAGTGVPLVPGDYPIRDGSNVFIHGSYFV